MLEKVYTFVMGRPNPSKLANFPECDVFINISCAQTAPLDSKEFLAPVITPFEDILALDRGSQWTGAYVMNFQDVIGSPPSEVKEQSDEARYSFLQSGYVEDFSPGALIIRNILLMELHIFTSMLSVYFLVIHGIHRQNDTPRMHDAEDGIHALANVTEKSATG